MPNSWALILPVLAMIAIADLNDCFSFKRLVGNKAFFIRQHLQQQRQLRFLLV